MLAATTRPRTWSRDARSFHCCWATTWPTRWRVCQRTLWNATKDRCSLTHIWSNLPRQSGRGDIWLTWPLTRWSRRSAPLVNRYTTPKGWDETAVVVTGDFAHAHKVGQPLSLRVLSCHGITRPAQRLASTWSLSGNARRAHSCRYRARRIARVSHAHLPGRQTYLVMHGLRARVSPASSQAGPALSASIIQGRKTQSDRNPEWEEAGLVAPHCQERS